MNMQDVASGINKTSFIAIRVVGIVGSLLFAGALASSIKRRLDGCEEVEIAFASEEMEDSEEKSADLEEAEDKK